MSCPRCGAADCTNPDEKSCSDNCITRLYAERAALRTKLLALADQATSGYYGSAPQLQLLSRAMRDLVK